MNLKEIEEIKEELKGKQEEIKEKQEELKKMQEELNKKFEELNKKFEEVEKEEKNKKNGINYKPEMGENYYFIDIYDEVEHDSFGDSLYDNKLVKFHRVFETYEQAEKWLEIDKFLEDLSFKPNWNDNTQYKYYIYYNYERIIFDVCFKLVCDELGIKYYFKDRDVLNTIYKKYSIEDLKFYYNIED